MRPSLSYALVIVPPVGETVLTACPVAGSYSVVACGTACPTPPVVATVVGRPALSYEVVVVRVTPFAISVTLAALPHQSYSVVAVGISAGLVPPPVMAPAGPVEHTRSAHSGRPAQAPVPVADQ